MLEPRRPRKSQKNFLTLRFLRVSAVNVIS
jgi:hypothetical protein